MKEPPDDDALWPALILLFFTLLFVAGVLLMMWLAREYADFVPPSSTLAPLEP